VVLASRNGIGKTSLLEAIAAVRDAFTQHESTLSTLLEGGHWPSDVRAPLPTRVSDGSVFLEIELADRELKITGPQNPSQNDPVVVIETGGTPLPQGQVGHPVRGSERFRAKLGLKIIGQVVQKTLDQPDRLLRIFDPHPIESCVGRIDFISASREYGVSRTPFGYAAKSRMAQPFPLGGQEHVRATHDVRQILVNTYLAEFSEWRRSGQDPDSLRPLREEVSMLMYPKEFLGFQRSDSGAAWLAIKTPWGTHDVADLSRGEQDIFWILAYFFVRRQSADIVLWDTPEAHLNPSVHALLLDSLRRIAPKNQWWIATHSQSLIGSVADESLYYLELKGDRVVVRNGADDPVRIRSAAYAELGANPSLALVSSRILFVEGGESSVDCKIIERLVRPRIPGLNIIPGTNADTILAAGARANQLFKKLAREAEAWVLLDRDYRSLVEAKDFSHRYQKRVIFWPVHELENILLRPIVLQKTLLSLGLPESETSEERLLEDLRNCARSIQMWVACDWYLWSIEQQHKSFRRHIPKDNPLDATVSVLNEVLAAKIPTDQSKTKDAIYSKHAELDHKIADGSFLTDYPGKELLAVFLEEKWELKSKLFIDAAVATVVREGIELPEIEWLCEQLTGRNDRVSGE